MGSIASILGALAETIKFDINSSCCNDNDYRRIRISAKSRKKIKLNSVDESVLVLGNHVYKFETRESLIGFVENLAKNENTSPPRSKSA